MRRQLVAVAVIAVAAGCGASERRAGPQTAVETETAPAAAPERETAPIHPPAARRFSVREFGREHARRDERLTEVVDSLLPVETDVRCWTTDDWQRATAAINDELPPNQRGEFSGFADLYALEIDLAPWVCETLARLPHDYARLDRVDAADAVLTLAHEIRHLTSAGSNEALAQCRALQRVDDTAVALGLSTTHARELARTAWRDVHPTLPRAYRSPDCRPGGKLDEEPQTPEFP